MALGRKPIEIVNEGKHQLLAKAEHWKRIYLKEVAKVQNGFAFSSSNFVKAGGLPLIRIRDIDNVTTVDRYNGLFSDEFIVKKGDVLVGMDGDFKASVWKGENALLNQRVCRIIPNNKNFDPKFLFLCLQPYLNAINEETSSITVKHLSSRTIEEIPLPYPSLSEQQAIVSHIEELLSDLENGTLQLKSAQQQLKVYRQSLLKTAFEGRLTNKVVIDDELPKGWKWVKLEDVGKISGGLTKNSKREKLPLKLPFLRVGNVYFNRLDLKEMHLIGINEDEIERVKLEKNDLLFVEGNGSLEQIGRVALWSGVIENCVHQNHLIKARLTKNVFPKYAMYFYCSQTGRDKIEQKANSTSGLYTLNLTKISSLELPLPPLEEQKLIVSELESKLTICDKMEETISQSLQKAESLRQSILKKAFEGKLI